MGAAIFIVVVFGLLFAMLIVPRQRELRRHTALIASIQVGDEVMTGSGIYGTIDQLEADFAYLEVAPGTVIKLARRAIASKVEAHVELPVEISSEAAEPVADADVDLRADDADQALTSVDHDADGPES